MKRTWAFVSLEDEFGSERAVALRNGEKGLANARHLNAFIKARGLTITGIYLYDAETIAEAMDWVSYFTYLGRRGL